MSLLLSKDIEKSEQIPHWVKSNPIFQKIKLIRKIFPEIGLDNYEEKASLSNAGATLVAEELIRTIKNICRARQNVLTDFILHAKLGEVRREFAQDLIQVFQAIWDAPIKDFLLPNEKGVISLILPQDVFAKTHEGQPLFKRGMGLIKLYGRMVDNLVKHRFLALPKLEELYEYRQFSSINLPSKDCSLVFSSAGSEGFWDLLTMSMRGIKSCQTWDGANNFVRVIGSAVDPMTAIIYLTNGSSTSHGTKMVRRSIVRYAISNGDEPTIILEKMYPAFDQDTLNSFKGSIEKRCSLRVVYIGDAKHNHDDLILSTKYLSPSSPELKMLGKSYRPYVDSSILYAKGNEIRNAFSRELDNVKIPFINNVAPLFLKLLRSHRTVKDLSMNPSSRRFIEKVLSKSKDQKVILSGKKVPAADFGKLVAVDLANICFNKYVARHMKMPENSYLIEGCAQYLMKFRLDKIFAYRLSSKIVNSLEDNKLYN